MDWADTYVPMDMYENFSDWIGALNTEFLENGRNSIFDIFDDADFEQANLEFLYSKQQQQLASTL